MEISEKRVLTRCRALEGAAPCLACNNKSSWGSLEDEPELKDQTDMCQETDAAEIQANPAAEHAVMASRCHCSVPPKLAHVAAEAAGVGVTDMLPPDAALIQGTLSNGLKYFVHPHDVPKAHAHVRLAVNVGSCVEEEARHILTPASTHAITHVHRLLTHVRGKYSSSNCYFGQNERGFAHFVEHCAFRGTNKYALAYSR